MQRTRKRRVEILVLGGFIFGADINIRFIGEGAEKSGLGEDRVDMTYANEREAIPCKSFNLIILNLVLDDQDSKNKGLERLREARELYPNVETIVIFWGPEEPNKDFSVEEVSKGATGMGAVIYKDINKAGQRALEIYEQEQERLKEEIKLGWERCSLVKCEGVARKKEHKTTVEFDGYTFPLTVPAEKCEECKKKEHIYLLKSWKENGIFLLTDSGKMQLDKNNLPLINWREFYFECYTGPGVSESATMQYNSLESLQDLNLVSRRAEGNFAIFIEGRFYNPEFHQSKYVPDGEIQRRVPINFETFFFVRAEDARAFGRFSGQREITVLQLAVV